MCRVCALRRCVSAADKFFEKLLRPFILICLEMTSTNFYRQQPIAIIVWNLIYLNSPAPGIIEGSKILSTYINDNLEYSLTHMKSIFNFNPVSKLYRSANWAGLTQYVNLQGGNKYYFRSMVKMLNQLPGYQWHKIDAMMEIDFEDGEHHNNIYYICPWNKLQLL